VIAAAPILSDPPRYRKLRLGVTPNIATPASRTEDEGRYGVLRGRRRGPSGENRL